MTIYLNGMFAVQANPSGALAFNLPAGIDANGLPLGLQAIGRGDEGRSQ